jgi:hypothetical protein
VAFRKDRLFMGYTYYRDKKVCQSVSLCVFVRPLQQLNQQQHVRRQLNQRQHVPETVESRGSTEEVELTAPRHGGS